MQLPFFYTSQYTENASTLVLDEDTSRHVIQVLRMNKGDQLHLTDGKGHLLLCEIAEEHRKACVVSVTSSSLQPSASRLVTIAISLIKNTSRFEWFLEKATEIGVREIIPLICERTEKEKFRQDRLQSICISAMLQSRQCWLPVLQEPVSFDNWIQKNAEEKNSQRFIAHCEQEGRKQTIRDSGIQSFAYLHIAIGPEGDFSPKEIKTALESGFIPVSLGETRLRTETAGVVAAALLVNG
jgi:16S rRNA (uracil1498-N3)-methyltransferase